MRAQLLGASAATALFALLALAAAPPHAAVAQSPGQITLSGSPRPAQSLEPGSFDVVLLAVTATVSADQELLFELQVDVGGSAGADALSLDGVRLWLDTNGSGQIDGIDQLLSTGTVVDGTARLKPNLVVWWHLPQQILLSVSITADAPAGKSLTLAIPSPEAVTSSGDVTIGGSFPIESNVFFVANAADGSGETTLADGASQATVRLEEAGVTAIIPVGASADAIELTLSTVAAGTLPALPADSVGHIVDVDWTTAEGAVPVLASPVRIELDVPALLAEGVELASLQVLALGEDGQWRAVPTMLSVDGSALILSVSVVTTFTVVELGNAATGLIPPAGGSASSPDGSVGVDVPGGSSAASVQVSVTPALAIPVRLA